MSDGRSVEVIIEIPRGSRNKYEYDHERHVIRLDRRLFTATVYPADYGFIPGTLAKDGEPLDALVLLDDPSFPGCHVDARPIGLFRMTDEQGVDAKIICAPAADQRWADVHDIDQLPEHLRGEIEHFFTVYKTLEAGKSSTVRGYYDVDEAWEVIEGARRRAAGSPG